jgi:multidrug efflux pump subunit AcrA (membrane-fusion protein)
MTPPYSRHLSRFLLASGLLAALLAGCTQPPKPETTPAAPVHWDPASSVVLEQWTELVGTTQPLPECIAHITAPIEGRVVSLLKNAAGEPIHEGDEVTAGEVIANLDDRVARLNLSNAESAVKTAEQDKAQAQTALRLASDLLTTAETLKRKDPMLVADIEMNTKQGAVADARSKLASAEEKLDLAAKNVDAGKKQLQLYTLTTPRKGRLGRVQVALGQTLAIGAEIAVVVDLEDQIDVLSFVSQRVAVGLKLGQSAGAGGLDEKADEIRTTDAPGRIVFIAPQAEPETGCFAVKVRFPNKEAHLRGNVVQRVRVLTLPGKDYLALPESALLEDQDPPSVEIVEDVKTVKSADGKDQQTGTVRRLTAIVGVHDRVLHQVAILQLKDPEGKWAGKIEDTLFITKNGQGLQTGDAVRLEEEAE